jgi:hypothetical protein
LWLNPKFDNDNDYWLTLLHEEREAAMNRFTNEHPPPERNKARMADPSFEAYDEEFFNV